MEWISRDNVKKSENLKPEWASISDSYTLCTTDCFGESHILEISNQPERSKREDTINNSNSDAVL